MAIREDLVASATQFLQDPSVASSSVENRIGFLRSKNLTQEEIDVAMARVGGHGPPVPSPAYAVAPPPPPGSAQQYYPYPPGSWQQPLAPPKRDWRDWFIMATVVSGVGYGLYTIGKRYVYPAIAPPTPEKLEQDKKNIEEQFDRAFALVEQLAKDTESLKKAEQDRTEKLDAAIAELDTVMTDLKAANRRREDDAQRIRDEVQGLKDAIPKALDNQKILTDNRLREISGEMGSLKTLVSQRMAAPAVTAAPAASTSNYARPSVTSSASTPAAPAPASEAPAATAETPATPAEEPPKASTPTSFGRSSASAGLGSSGAKPSIPAWQMAMANKKAAAASTSSASSVTKPEDTGASSSNATTSTGA